MKELVDIQVALSTPDDLDCWEGEEAEMASEQLNTLLHMLYDRADPDTETQVLERQIQFVWENWREHPQLLDIDEQDLSDWVDHLLATWDDAHND